MNLYRRPHNLASLDTRRASTPQSGIKPFTALFLSVQLDNSMLSYSA